jgi:hypothetical protein
LGVRTTKNSANETKETNMSRDPKRMNRTELYLEILALMDVSRCAKEFQPIVDQARQYRDRWEGRTEVVHEPIRGGRSYEVTYTRESVANMLAVSKRPFVSKATLVTLVRNLRTVKSVLDKLSEARG